MEVLLVEDCTSMQSSLAAGLRALGYRVDVVNDTADALQYALAKNYDIIILDLILPKESSLLVLHEIRESDRDVEILILSARNQIHDRVTALIQGATDYLVKPFSCAELHARIQEILGHKIAAAPPEIETKNAAARSHDRTNRLIKNLLDNCRCEHGPIELVISEIKAMDLLRTVRADLSAAAREKDIRFMLPRGKMPTLLVDARLMQHLLIKLLTAAMRRCPANSEIGIALRRGGGYCSITIETPQAHSMSGSEVKNLFRDRRPGAEDDGDDRTIASLSLARNYAERMNFDLQASQTRQGRFRLRLSNIKII